MQVILAHVVEGESTAEEILAAVVAADPEPFQVLTFAGTILNGILGPDGEVIGNPDGTDIMSRLVKTDIPTCAGILHIVDKVLVPALPAEMPAGGEYGDVAGVYGDAGAY